MRKLIISLLLVLSAFILFFSCRKPDIVQAPDTKSQTQDNRFFNVPATASPQVKAIAEAVKRQDANFHFVSEVIKKAGYPIWDKARIHNNVNGTVSGRTTSDSIPDEVVYIPFVLDSGSTTNAVLSVAVDGPDTTYRIAYAKGYRAFGYNTTTNGWNARKAFALFAGFDYTVFGHRQFTIKDTLLFPVGVNRGSITATLKEHNGQLLGRTTDLLECWSAEVCWEICMVRTTSFWHCETYHGCFPPGGSSVVAGNSSGSSGTPLSSGWTPSGGSGTGNPSGTGTGNPSGGGTGGSGGSNGDSGWWAADPCPPPAQARTTDAACTLGWTAVVTPVPPPVINDDPCNRSDRISGSTATLQYSVFKPNALQFAPFDPNTQAQPEQYFIVNAINGSNVADPIQSLPTGGGQMQGVTPNMVMAFHTHPNGGYPFPSPVDFFGLADFGANFQMHYVIAYDGTKYAMVVNSYTQLQAFVAANPGALAADAGFEATSRIGLQSQDMQDLLVAQGYSQDEAYERTLAYLMKDAGVTLLKANAGSDTFKKIGLRQKLNADGSPAVNANGKPVYEKADCP